MNVKTVKVVELRDFQKSLQLSAEQINEWISYKYWGASNDSYYRFYPNDPDPKNPLKDVLPRIRHELDLSEDRGTFFLIHFMEDS